MDAILELVKQLIDPDWIMAHGGLFLVAFIIFAETGLFIGFFLPGDSLLFITGMIIAAARNNPFPTESHPVNLVFWIILLTIAAILGNMVGYWFGKKSGPLLFERKESWLFKRKHLENAHDFYEKRGGVAIIVARFLPVVRTFAPIVAGVVHMTYQKFVVYNVIGAICWIASLTTLGYLLGDNQWIKEQLEWIVLGLILVTTLPVVFKIFLKKKKKPSNLSNGEITSI